jgi:transcriptional regulator with XRE-family HTH domain
MDAKTTLGRTIKKLRESRGLSQEKLAEAAEITYQYVSDVENGKQNFSIGVLESVAAALGLSLSSLVEAAYANPKPTPLLDPRYFVAKSPLPPELTASYVETALNETHRIIRLINTTLIKVANRPLSSYIQGNNFSGIVSNILCDAFSRMTPYKHNHDQKYPDLLLQPARGANRDGLEVKTTIRPGKGGESHNGHSGWHVIACYELDKVSGDICFLHVMFADLVGHGGSKADWKYVGSTVNKDTGSQRTETYTTTPAGTAKLRHGTVYLNSERIDVSRWRTDPSVRGKSNSPFISKKKVTQKKHAP